MVGIPEIQSPLHYWRMNPTGNITLLVEGEGMPENAPFAALAEQLMKEERGAEQTGFVFFEDAAAKAAGADLRLRMAGGEFCGNAALSAAALFAMKHEMMQGTVRVLVSGADDPVAVEISGDTDAAANTCALKDPGQTAAADGNAADGNAADGNTEEIRGLRFSGRVHMPRPEGVEEVQLCTDAAEDAHPETHTFPLVRFAGISHVILEADRIALSREAARRLVSIWCETLGVDALGLMFVDLKTGRLDPLVYVPEADTLFWESSCASGTTAVGAWMHSKTKKAVSLALSQPGGVLRVSADQKSLILGGSVSVEKSARSMG